MNHTWLDAAVAAAQNDAITEWLRNPIFPRSAALLKLESAAMSRRIEQLAIDLGRLCADRLQTIHIARGTQEAQLSAKG